MNPYSKYFEGIDFSKPQVFVHRYLGCLATREKTECGYLTVYAFTTDVSEYGGYGLATIQEMLDDCPSAWKWLGEL